MLPPWPWVIFPSWVIPVLFCANPAGIIPAIKANARMDDITIELILKFIIAFYFKLLYNI
jgi:hypothetical protein